MCRSLFIILALFLFQYPLKGICLSDWQWPCEWPLVYKSSTLNQTENAKVVQYSLNNLGYSDIKVDGIYGRASEEAVKEVQKKGGIEADGVVGKNTWSLLLSSVSISDSGSLVMAVQDLLLFWRFNNVGDVDGKFGSKTEKAVEDFQTSRNVKIDGIVDKSVWLLFLTGCNSSNEQIFGLDLSKFEGKIPLDTFKCYVNYGFRFAIFQAQMEDTSVNPYVINDIHFAHQAGFNYVDVYFFLDFRKDHAFDQINSTMHFLESNNASNFERVWFDIEGHEPTNVTHNVAFVQEARYAVESHGKTVGIYCGREWPTFFGTYSGMSDLPLWYAHYDGIPGFYDWGKYGGWEHPTVKQFFGDHDICGLKTDWDYAHSYPSVKQRRSQ